MNKTIPARIIRASSPAPRPTLYLLNGSQGGPNGSGWDTQTDAPDYLRGKDVNVVNPIGGGGSYYTDWIREDPVLGVNKWQTFLNEELPAAIEEHLGASRTRAAVGVSMSGTSVLNLAIVKPGFWQGVASYSGCAQTSDPVGGQYVRVTVENWSGASSVENMWGPIGGPVWRANDPLLNADRLRGTAIYLSSGTGVAAAPHDTPADRRVTEGLIPLPVQIAFGGPIEAAVHTCTANMAARLRELNIPATVNDRPVGTHSWGYWEDDLHDSWPFLAGTLGVRP
ncbi:alpha/beta hydrolase [Nocardia yamanashiensis]|uniref:alpha/beta hydrolase n=1 Tax=Nocardia yamanashiensis TaxID=209247 RepID=UPI001F26B19D|nr:alpha/beta hydrolase family protein [Nocardia yamanashiensis]